MFKWFTKDLKYEIWFILDKNTFLIDCKKFYDIGPRFKDKTPTPLTNLDTLLEATYRQVFILCVSIKLISLSVCLLVDLPVCLTVCCSDCLCVCDSVSLPVCFIVCLSVCLPVWLPSVQPAYVPACSFVCLFNAFPSKQVIFVRLSLITALIKFSQGRS